MASDRLAVACAKAHKGGDANAKVVPCDPRIYTNNSNHSSSTKKKTQKHHKIRKATSREAATGLPAAEEGLKAVQNA